MADFVFSAPITVRTEPKFTLIYRGGGFQPFLVNGVGAAWYSSVEILGNPQHFLREAVASVLESMRSGDVAGIVTAQVDGRWAQIVVRREDFAKIADEVARYEDWSAGVALRAETERKEERAYDLAFNEGGEGYNPHRHGDRPTYHRTRTVFRERDDE